MTGNFRKIPVLIVRVIFYLCIRVIECLEILRKSIKTDGCQITFQITEKALQSPDYPHSRSLYVSFYQKITNEQPQVLFDVFKDIFKTIGKEHYKMMMGEEIATDEKE